MGPRSCPTAPLLTATQRCLSGSGQAPCWSAPCQCILHKYLVSKRLIKIARKQPGLSSGCSWGPPANLLQPVRLHSESPSLESCHHRQYLTPTTILYFIVCFPAPPLSPLTPPQYLATHIKFEQRTISL